jgi:7-cyano-7-deazaguanine synthase
MLVDELYLLSFNYGQRHAKELEYAKKSGQRLGAMHEVVDIHVLSQLLSTSGSVLVSNNPVPDGHYAEENMRQTVVPNRNMILLSIAVGRAVAVGAEHVWSGVHSGDHFIYPDCRPDFYKVLNEAVEYGNEGFLPQHQQEALVGKIEGMGILEYIKTPFAYWDKSMIVQHGVPLHVPFEETWSCYKGGDLHCGRCGTCVERQEAFAIAGVTDPTKYEDPEYWHTVTQVPEFMYGGSE